MIYQYALLFASTVGFLWGWWNNDFSLTVYTILATAAVVSLVVLPPWPVFRRNPVPWLTKTAKS